MKSIVGKSAPDHFKRDSAYQASLGGLIESPITRVYGVRRKKAQVEVERAVREQSLPVYQQVCSNIPSKGPQVFMKDSASISPGPGSMMPFY